MMFDLKPCPFCGGEAKLCTSVTSGSIHRPIAWVKCVSCDCGTPSLIDSGKDGKNILEVVDMWNKRAGEEADE